MTSLDILRNRHRPEDVHVGCGHQSETGGCPIGCPQQTLERICAGCGEQWPCDTKQALDHADQLEAHSITLNTISWKIAEAIGYSIDSRGQIIANPETLAQELINLYRDQRSHIHVIQQQRGRLLAHCTNTEEIYPLSRLEILEILILGHAGTGT